MFNTQVQMQTHTARIMMPKEFVGRIYLDFKEVYTLLLESNTILQVEIEMGNLFFFDHILMDALLELNEQALAHDKRITLLNPSKRVLDLLKITSPGYMFKVKDSGTKQGSAQQQNHKHH